MNKIVALGAGLAALAALSGCKTLDKVLNTADAALDVVQSGSVQAAAAIAGADDPEQALKDASRARADYYKHNPQAAIDDIRAVKRDFERLMALLAGNVSATWGRSEVKVPSRKEYVKYTQNYMSRAVVDFDAGRITVETLDTVNPDASLRNAIVTTLLTPDDPRAVDLFSDKPVELNGRKDPYLKHLVLDHKGRVIDEPAVAEAFADHLLATAKRERNVQVDGAGKHARFVQIAMVSNFSNKQAEKYSALVERYAKQNNVSPSLVYAIIRAESNFNPYAVSHVPAYGLMQLVPTSGGRDAYRKVTGNDGVPSKEYLFEAENNIELGSAYLNILSFAYLQNIQNDISREYCVISAYNTGTGNVLKAFAKDRVDAVNGINGRSPAEVYEKLRRDLPYEETRAYLQKVVGYRKDFVKL